MENAATTTQSTSLNITSEWLGEKQVRQDRYCETDNNCGMVINMCPLACHFYQSKIIVARFATIQVEDGEGTIFGVTNGLQAFLDTGLLGAVVLTLDH